MASAPADPAEIARLAAHFGTPFYLYDGDAAVARIAALREGLGTEAGIYYCAKANPATGVLTALRPVVDGLDVSSAGEIRLGERCGFDPAVMSFAGPGKSEEELRVALGSGVTVSLESVREMRLLARLAATTGARARVTFRLNPKTPGGAFAMKMGGGPSAFGIPEEDALEAVSEGLRTASLEVAGFHVYPGTQSLDESAIVASIDDTLRLTTELSAALRFEPAFVNLGGGFGVPYFEGQKALDPLVLGSAIAGRLAAVRASDGPLRSARFVLELGRYVMAPAGLYVCRVLDVKETRGKRFVVLDGGMHHFFTATGHFGQVLKRNYPVLNVSRSGEGLPHELVGPLCTPLDTLGRGVVLPKAEVGDLIAFTHAGAYGLTASPVLFLGHPSPPELVRRGGEIVVSRRRIHPEELELR